MSDVLQTTPVGATWPERPAPFLPDIGPREGGLRALREYMASLVFRRTMAPGDPPRGFKLPPERIHVFQPDDVVEMKMPSVAFVPIAGGTLDFYGLGPPTIQESSIDVHGPGTALYRIADIVEPFSIEVWSAKHATRRAIIEGLIVALSAFEESQSIRLRMPDYFNELVEFTLDTSTYFEEPDAVRNRRRAQIGSTLRAPILALANYTELRTQVCLGGQDGSHVWDGNVYLDFGVTIFDRDAIVRGSCWESEGA